MSHISISEQTNNFKTSFPVSSVALPNGTLTNMDNLELPVRFNADLLCELSLHWWIDWFQLQYRGYSSKCLLGVVAERFGVSSQH